MKRTEEPTTAEIRPEDHGTPRGYRLGCRLDDCPGLTRAGRMRSCVQAFKEQQRDRNDTRTKREAAGLAMPAPSVLAAVEPPPTPPDHVATETEIREWARANGVDVNDRGRVPAAVRAAYSAATLPTAPKPSTPAPLSKPLTAEPVSEEAATAVDDSTTAYPSWTPSVDELKRSAAPAPTGVDELDTAYNTIANLRTALAAAAEATALATKQRDDALAEGAKLSDALKRLQDEHEAVVANLDQARATQLAETRRADELLEQLDAARVTRSQLERIEESYRPDVVPVVTGGDNPPTTVMTVGDVRLELPAGEVAQLKVDLGGVHVQIGR